MPGSVAGVGHDKHGVNMHNLRAATAHRSYRNLGGFRPPFDWKQETDAHMTMARSVKLASASVCDQSVKMQGEFATRTTAAEARVNEALQTRAEKIGALKEQLEETVVKTDTELVKLQKNRSKLERIVSQKAALLDVNERRLDVRSGRPVREMVADEVQRRLVSQTRLLQTDIDKLQRCIKKTEQDAVRLEDSRAVLTLDLKDKAEALALENQCMSLTQATQSTEGQLQKKQLSYPHKWSHSTNVEVKEARHRIGDAARLRTAIDSVVVEMSAAERAANAQVEEALREKISATQVLKVKLDKQLAATLEELSAAEVRKVDLEAALDEKKAPLALGKQRYAIRRNRPERELVHDEVEDALTAEFNDLRFITQQLAEKLKAVNREILHLRSAAEELKSNIADKAAALSMDEACLSQVENARSTASVASFATSTRSATAQRIEELEQSLMEARDSRQRMETQLNSLLATRTGSSMK